MVWAGSRSREFEMRLNGASYQDIAAAGGGIFSTVTHTRKASESTLLSLARHRARHFLTQGITTLEVKTGYGLDLATELKLLRVIQALNQATPQDIHATFLGAHALPPEFSKDTDAYVDLVIQQMLPAVKTQGIATAVDVFCEGIAFSRDQTQRIFTTAVDLGLRVKLHAEQLSDSGGAALAASYRALSCDHLEYLSKQGMTAMAENHVTAVMLPGAFHYLKQTQKPPVAQLRNLDIPMALATDLNPGTSPVFSMTQVMNLACLLFGMTCEEALAGATIHGARALGLENTKGSLEPGKDADITLWQIQTPADLSYLTGILAPEQVVISGKIAYTNTGRTETVS
jgi:imidazolonepropionase